VSIAAPRILIVDDTQEHGEAIARTLWKLGFAGLFVKYDEADLLAGIYGPYQGVRLVFMDLDLAGEGRVGDGSRAYSDVTAVIQTLLEEGNGPWVLVTWTGHADHSGALFAYIKQRLPPHMHPVRNYVMNKEELLDANGGEKGENDDGTRSLKSRVSELTRQEGAIGCLLGWEAAIRNSASQVVSELTNTAKVLDGNVQANIGQLLFELARAEAGATMENISDYAPSLYRVMAALLSDKLAMAVPDDEKRCVGPALSAVDGGNDITNWKREVNGMLHLEGGYSAGSCPGALFAVTDERELPHPLDNRDIHSLIEKQFLFPRGAKEARQRDLVKNSSFGVQKSTSFPLRPHSYSNRRVNASN